jgi:TfoX/Sxy family transcriptional regulator of competence genes
MASSREYLDYVLEQLRELDDVSYYPMMGEYVIYYDGKVVGGIYDDRFLLKVTDGVRQLMAENDMEMPMEIPYEGAKAMLSVDIDDRDMTCEIIRRIAADLPVPKKRKPKK